MWVRAQVDYLQRLPNDVEKRKALKELPPDLPQTYIRIFEIIDRTYPTQTTKYIQRLLKWLVLNFCEVTLSSRSPASTWLAPVFLCEVICVENESDKVAESKIPTVQQILGWLGCLGRRTKSLDIIELSHFTVKEFLGMDPEKVSSAVARKYLVRPEDGNYLLKVCLTYLMHDDFSSTTWSTFDELERFKKTYPLYGYAALKTCVHIFGN
jgi:hypothetical protein